MPGKNFHKLALIAAEQQGLVATADAREAGVDPHRLVDMERRGTIERVARGVYRFPLLDSRPALGQLAQATMWADRRGVLSHDTALDLYELCDVNPAQIHITIPTTYRLQKQVPRLYALHQRDLEKGERTLYEGIPIVTPQRAIVDGIESGLRTDLLRQAIETARGRGQLRGPELTRIRRQLQKRGRP
ncbi:MAG: type IV toxin-antitoxin system AbiEi family antitoxin domain-containing protein [Actinomycetota bacterium]|nr:type IV toxin-antitoxin system AbiEi family antitoxin domain-containing protein [Actinomycetota bacterium]